METKTSSANLGAVASVRGEPVSQRLLPLDAAWQKGLPKLKLATLV